MLIRCDLNRVISIRWRILIFICLLSLLSCHMESWVWLPHGWAGPIFFTDICLHITWGVLAIFPRLEINRVFWILKLFLRLLVCPAELLANNLLVYDCWSIWRTWINTSMIRLFHFFVISMGYWFIMMRKYLSILLPLRILVRRFGRISSCRANLFNHLFTDLILFLLL